MTTCVPLRLGLVATLSSEESDRQAPAASAPPVSPYTHHVGCTCRDCVKARLSADLEAALLR